MSGDREALIAALAPPPGIICMAEAQQHALAVSTVVIRNERRAVEPIAYRYIERAPKAGPRGGDDRFRAKAKAGRKANRQRRLK